MAKYVALTVRKLKPGSYDDWRKAWEGDRSDFPEGAHAYVCRNMKDADEIVAFGMVETDDISQMGSDEMRQAQERAHAGDGAVCRFCRYGRRLRGDRRGQQLN